MSADLERLNEALRAIAHDDEADLRRAAPRIEAAILAEFRARMPTRRAGFASRAAGLGIAALLAVGVTATLWMAGRAPRVLRPVVTEVGTAFMPLPYHAVPYTDARIVRLKVPRTALAAFGLAPDATGGAGNDTVLADVVVGEDGLARAVRFVRASSAPGEMP